MDEKKKTETRNEVNCPFHLSPRFSLLSFTFLLSLPPESSSEFPSEEQVIAHPPSLPFLPPLLPPLPASLGLSLCLCKAFLSVPITCPPGSLLSPSPLSFSGCMKGAPCGHRRGWWKKSKQR